MNEELKAKIAGWVKDGEVEAKQPPMYAVSLNGRAEFIKDDAELEDVIKQLGGSNVMGSIEVYSYQTTLDIPSEDEVEGE